MKKSLCLILALIMALFAFAGCNSTPAPVNTDRWEDGEAASYTISLLDKSYNEREWNNENTGDFYEYKTDVPGVPVMPQAVGDGSVLNYRVTKDASNRWVIETEMYLYQTYATSKFVSDWESVFTDESAKQAVIVEKSATEVTFLSTMTSRAVFGSVAKGEKPVSSEKKVKGAVVYLDRDLKCAVAFNDFETTTTYTGADVKSTFKDNTGTVEGKEAEVQVALSDGLVFDNESMMFAIRSVDLKMLKESSTTILDFYNATEQSTQQVTVAYNRDDFSFPGSEEPLFRIGATPNGMGYPYYFYFEQKQKAPPTSFSEPPYKYVMVAMSQGYLRFTLAAFN